MRLPDYTGEGVHAAGGFAVAAEGVEFIGMAHGAQAGNVHPRGVDAGRQELAAISLRPGRCARAPLRRTARPLPAPLRSSTSRCRARWPHAGPRAACRSAAAWLRRPAGDPRHRSAPAGMHRGHRAMALIGQQDGDAIGGLHRHHRARACLRAGRRPDPELPQRPSAATHVAE